MRHVYITTIIFLVITVLFMSGCATTPNEITEFEPIVRPVAPEPSSYSQGSLFQQRSISLFEDPKPYRIGDILTVILNESTSASKNAGTNTSKDEEISMDDPTLLGKLATRNGAPVLPMDVAQERSFSGSSDSNQSNSLNGEITVTVVDILPNGNLVVQGEKWFTLNQGKEYIRLAGVVRPADVAPNNTVSSSKLADAQIAYSGEGFLADANNQGWFGKMINSPYWPF